MLSNGKEDNVTMALITIDTNIAIQALAGNQNAVESVERNECLVSFMLVIELLSWKAILSQKNLIINFLEQCIVKDNDNSLQQIVIDIRLKYGLKIPDAFIAGTALHYKLPLISGDPIFKRITELELIFVEF